MKTPLLYGFLNALGSAILTLLMFFAGFHDTPEKMQASRWIGLGLGCAISITCLALAMRDKRARAPGEWGYGSALSVGTLTALFAALISGVFMYIYFAFINPGFGDVIYQTQVAAMEAKNIPADRIAAAEPTMRKFMSAPILTLSQIFVGFIIGFILALIVAAFFKQPASPVAPELPPAVA
jgi:hypothetical protein